jgi:hypothetical protein
MQKAREGRLLLHKSLGMAALASRYAGTPFNMNVQKTSHHGVSHGRSGFRLFRISFLNLVSNLLPRTSMLLE